MLDGQLSDVGNGDLVTPLLGSSRDLLDGHGLADRRDAFRERRVGEGNTEIPRCGVGSPKTFGKSERIAELVSHQLLARQRERFLGDIVGNIGRKLGGLVRRHVTVSPEMATLPMRYR